jgi:hypothetical protein
VTSWSGVDGEFVVVWTGDGETARAEVDEAML